MVLNIEGFKLHDIVVFGNDYYYRALEVPIGQHLEIVGESSNPSRQWISLRYYVDHDTTRTVSVPYTILRHVKIRPVNYIWSGKQ